MSLSYKACKRIYWLSPVLAAVVSAGWLLHQQAEISEVRDDVAFLGELPNEPRPVAEDTSGDSWFAALEGNVKSGKWETIAHELEIMLAGKTGIRPEFQEQFHLLSSEELQEALRQLENRELPGNVRSSLQNMLMTSLITKDPRAALDYLDLSGEDDPSACESAFRLFLVTNPSEAVAWYEQQIRDGKLDQKALKKYNVTHVSMESQLLPYLASQNPAAASARMKGMPPDFVREIFSNFNAASEDPATQKAYLAYMRENLSEDKVLEGISRLLEAQQYRGGESIAPFEYVTDFLDQIGASPAERQVTISVTYDNLKGSDLSLMDDADDEAIYRFLKQGDHSAHKEQAEALARKITDGDLRSEILKRLNE